MSRLVINGGTPLNGDVNVHGAKNSVLPILSATVLANKQCIIHNCPDLSDVRVTFDILRHLGGKVSYSDGTAVIDPRGINGHSIDEDLMEKMRSSVIFLGALLGRMKKAEICYPGGCELGPRPIDLHLKAMRNMGVKIKEEHGYICSKSHNAKGTSIHFDFPSVGATENIMLLASVTSGITCIHNAAREPEIVDLQNFLNKMGADVRGAGSSSVTVFGKDKLEGAEHTVIPDRIVTSSYLIATAATNGDVWVKNADASHLKSVISVLEECGCKVSLKDGGIRLSCPHRLKAVDHVRTMPHPGFPTDVQAPLTALLSVCDGTSIVVENMFESRYKHTAELCRMGADIKIDGRVAVIKGVERLSGAKVTATDLRGAAALIVAGLNAEGTTEINGLEHLYRGYDSFDHNLRSLGATIKCI